MHGARRQVARKTLFLKKRCTQSDNVLGFPVLADSKSRNNATEFTTCNTRHTQLATISWHSRDARSSSLALVKSTLNTIPTAIYPHTHTHTHLLQYTQIEYSDKVCGLLRHTTVVTSQDAVSDVTGITYRYR